MRFTESVQVDIVTLKWHLNVECSRLNPPFIAKQGSRTIIMDITVDPFYEGVSCSKELQSRARTSEYV